MRTTGLLVALGLACVLGYTNALFGITTRKFYVAGGFTAAYNTTNGVAGTVGYVSSYNGNVWDMLNGGADGQVLVVHVDSLFNVYIGGKFSNAGGVSTGPLAIWKRGATNWAAVGGSAFTYASDDSATGWVQSLVNKGIYAVRTDCFTVNNGGCDIYIGGLFEFAASDGAAVNVAKYDSSSSKWLALGGKDKHGLNPAASNNDIVYSLWKKQASCSASIIGSSAGVACNLWITGSFSQVFKIYNSKTSAWTAPTTSQAIADSSTSSSGAFVGYTLFYQSYLIANDEVYIGGNFDFADSSSGRCKYICKVVVTNSNSSPTFTLSSVGTSGNPPNAAVKSVYSYYASYTDYAFSQNPSAVVYAAGTFTSSASTSNVLKYSGGSWGQISSSDTTDIGVNGTDVNTIWVCGQASFDCKTGSVAVGGKSGISNGNLGYARYYNVDGSGTWNNFGGGVGTGAVLSIDSAQSAGSTAYVSFSCVAIVFLAMLFVTLF
jgi:hypothetical protein